MTGADQGDGGSVGDPQTRTRTLRRSRDRSGSAGQHRRRESASATRPLELTAPVAGSATSIS